MINPKTPKPLDLIKMKYIIFRFKLIKFAHAGVQKIFSHLDSALEKYTIRIASSRRKDCCMSRFLHLSKKKFFSYAPEVKNFCPQPLAQTKNSKIFFLSNLIKKMLSSGFIAQLYVVLSIFRVKIEKN